MKKNPPFRHFYSITLVISRLCGDGWRMEVTDGGMLGEELANLAVRSDSPPVNNHSPPMNRHE
jgi:hypothetical protein